MTSDLTTLLARDAGAAAAAWAAADDAALDAEVAAYRALLDKLKADLAARGVAVPLDEGGGGEGGPPEGVEVWARCEIVMGRLRLRGRWSTVARWWPCAGSAACVRGRWLPRPRPPTPFAPPFPQGVEGVDWHYGSLADLDPAEWRVPPHCVPVHANVTTMDWAKLRAAVGPSGFDAIMMDPPWQLATANPTRGVALGYSQLTDRDIENLPIPDLQTGGYLFVWVINAKYRLCLDMFAKWGYECAERRERVF